jgi:hypothetical protein
MGDTARLFALANIAGADAIICAWEVKRRLEFWRPITAIREGDNDGNPWTKGDSAWTPFLATPPYPDYTSGANSLMSAITRTLALFFGSDRLTFDLSSESPLLLADDARTLRYRRFSDVAKDVVDVRVYQGIHFRFADAEGRRVGRNVADHVFENFLERDKNKHDDD